MSPARPVIPGALDRVLVAAGVAVVVVLAGAIPVSAHAVLTASNPGDGARLDSAPDTVTLEFSEAVSADLGGLRVYESGGDRVDTGETRTDGDTAAIDLEADLPDGARRRRSVNGRMTRPYWDCLKSPRRRSATDQMKAAVWEWFSVFKSAVLVWLHNPSQIIHSGHGGVAHAVLGIPMVPVKASDMAVDQARQWQGLDPEGQGAGQRPEPSQQSNEAVQWIQAVNDSMGSGHGPSNPP